MSRTTSNALFTAAVLAVSATSVFGATPQENDVMELAHTKVSLTQAISAAEQHAGGRAARAELERTRTGMAYDVEVVNGNAVSDVKVDSESGEVIASSTDKTDHDDETQDPRD